MDRPEITYTPFVIWGAGVSAQEKVKPVPQNPMEALYWLRDDYFIQDRAAVRTWPVHTHEAHLIDQVDIVPLVVRHYIPQRNATQHNTTQRNTTKRNTTQRNNATLKYNSLTSSSFSPT